MKILTGAVRRSATRWPKSFGLPAAKSLIACVLMSSFLGMSSNAQVNSSSTIQITLPAPGSSSTTNVTTPASTATTVQVATTVSAAQMALDKAALEKSKYNLWVNAPQLTRGIGLYGWMNGYIVNSMGQRADLYSLKELKNLSAMGFKHVRLPINPYLLISDWPGHKMNMSALAILDGIVKRIMDSNLSVVIEIAPDEPTPLTKNLCTSDPAVEDFAWMWQVLSKHYAGYDTRRVFYEVLNEPHFQSYLSESKARERWDYVLSKTVPVIRKNAPNNTIIVSGYDWSYIPSMQKAMLFKNDPNIMYTFHYYDPMVFSHQGSSWITVPDVYRLKEIPYPPTPDSCTSFKTGMVTATPEFIGWYCNSSPAKDMAYMMQSAASWAKSNGVKLYMGEFGVLKDSALPAARSAYLRDVRATAEANGIGWSMWDYKQGFDIFKRYSKTEYDSQTIEALGLKLPSNLKSL